MKIITQKNHWRGDRLFYALTLMAALGLIGIVLVITWELVSGSQLAFSKFGWKFITNSYWDPVSKNFGALPLIYGTIVSSLLALIIAVPLSLGIAIYLAELAPQWLRSPVSFLVELLAAIPSIVYGIWGIFVLIPLCRHPFSGIAPVGMGSSFGTPIHGFGCQHPGPSGRKKSLWG